VSPRFGLDPLEQRNSSCGNSQFADRGEDFQVRRVAGNVLNNQSRTAVKVWFSTLGNGRGNDKLYRKNNWTCHKSCAAEISKQQKSLMCN
jgi:hypothetical protein